MSNANKLLDKWMKVCSIKTQAEAAKRLGKAGSATISNWRSGYAKPDNESIALMCEQCGENAAYWIGVLNYEFEESPRMKKVWAQLAKIAAAIVLTAGLTGLTSTAANAQGAGFSSHNPANTVYYVKFMKWLA